METEGDEGLKFKAFSRLKPVNCKNGGDLQANLKVNISKEPPLLGVGCRRDNNLWFDMLISLIRPESVLRTYFNSPSE